MKKTLFATAMAVAVLASAPAFAQSVGYLGASYSHAEVDAFGADADGEAVAFAGSVTAPISENLSLSFDGSVTDGEDVTAGAGTFHLSDRLDKGLIGGFAGATSVSGETVWLVGMEGEAYFDAFTLGGSVTFASPENDDVDADFRLYNVDGRYFVNDNFRLDAGLGYLDGDIEDADLSAWVASIGAEYQLPATPVSFFGGYSRLDIEDVDVTVDTLSIGVRWTFGGTLKERDRAGGGLGGAGDVIGSLPL